MGVTRGLRGTEVDERRELRSQYGREERRENREKCQWGNLTVRRTRVPELKRPVRLPLLSTTVSAPNPGLLPRQNNLSGDSGPERHFPTFTRSLGPWDHPPDVQSGSPFVQTEPTLRRFPGHTDPPDSVTLLPPSPVSRAS